MVKKKKKHKRRDDKCFYSVIYMQYTVMKDLKTSSEKLVAVVSKQPQFNDTDEETECQNWILTAKLSATI